MKRITIFMLAISASWALAMKETPKAISDKDEPFRCFLNPYDPSWKGMPPEEKESLAAIEALDARKDHFDFFSWIKGFDIDVTSNRELALLLIDAHAKKSETGLITNARATKLSWLRTLVQKEKASPEKGAIVETPLQSTAPIAIPTEKEIVVVPTTDPSTPVLDLATQTASKPSKSTVLDPSPKAVRNAAKELQEEFADLISIEEITAQLMEADKKACAETIVPHHNKKERKDARHKARNDAIAAKKAELKEKLNLKKIERKIIAKTAPANLQTIFTQTASEKDIVIEKEDPAMLVENQKKAAEILAWIKKANQNAIEALTKRYETKKNGQSKIIKTYLEKKSSNCLSPLDLKPIGDCFDPNFNSTINSLDNHLKEKAKAISTIESTTIRKQLNNDLDKSITESKDKVIGLKIQSLQTYYETLTQILRTFLEKDLSKEIMETTMTAIYYDLHTIYRHIRDVIGADHDSFESILKNSCNANHPKLIELKNTGNLLLKKYEPCINGFLNAYKKDPLFDGAGSRKSSLISIYTNFSKTWPLLFDAPSEKFDE